MALRVNFFLIADEFPVKAGETIIAGQPVSLVATTNTFDNVANAVEAVLADGNTQVVVGIAGDTKDNAGVSASASPFTSSVVIGANGQTRPTQNRISDLGDETAASGMLTVYHNGGTFATDQYVAAPAAGWATPLATIYAGTGANKGKLTTDTPASTATPVGKVISVGALQSGVPGTDVNGSMTLGNYLTFILSV